MRNKVGLVFLGVCALLLCARTFAASSALMSLTARYSVTLSPVNNEGVISFPVVGGDVQIKAVASSQARLRLIEPSGKEHSNSTAASAVNFEHSPMPFTADTQGQLLAMWVISVPAAMVGEYQLIISDKQLPKAVLPVTVHHTNSTLKTVAGFNFKSEQLKVGHVIAVSALVYDEEHPVLDATVFATLLNAQGTEIASIELHHGDEKSGAASKGMYEAFLTLNEAGAMAVLVDIRGRTAKGQNYHANHLLPLTVAAANEIQLTGKFQEHGLDTNHDGLFDELRVTFDYSGQPSGEGYNLLLVLKEESDHYIHGYGKLEDGKLSVSIPTAKMKEFKTEGPYQLSAVTLTKRGEMLTHQKNFGQTKIYPRKVWDRKKVLLEQAKEQGKQFNNDGLIKELTIAVTIDSLVSGLFNLSVDLRGENGAMIDAAMMKVSLQKGLNEVFAVFDGEKIGQSGQNGPYIIGNASAYSNSISGSGVYAADLGRTNPYLCQEFVGCQAAN